jgi:hypothetical protein
MTLAVHELPYISLKEVMMAISGISSHFTVHQNQGGNQSHQIRMDVKALKRSLALGDLSGAQVAFNTLTQDAQAPTRRPEELHRRDSAESVTSSAFADFTSLNNAFQTNDLAGAQKAFASMLQDLGAKTHNLAGAPKAFTLMMQSLQNTVTTPGNSTGTIVDTMA